MWTVIYSLFIAQ